MIGFIIGLIVGAFSGFCIACLMTSITRKEKCSLENHDLKRANERIEALETAIRSLQAWEEVLQELENKRDFIGGLSKFDTYDMAIDIVNQKLAELAK